VRDTEIMINAYDTPTLMNEIQCPYCGARPIAKFDPPPIPTRGADWSVACPDCEEVEAGFGRTLGAARIRWREIVMMEEDSCDC